MNPNGRVYSGVVDDNKTIKITYNNDKNIFILTLNNYEFSFGTTNPIDQKRYILFGQEIYLTNDFLFPQLMVSFEFFLETKLLPDNINITSIKFPQYEIQKNDNKWVSTETDHSEEKIKQCLVYGDKKNYLVALIVVDSENKNDSTIGSIIENLNKKLSIIEKIKKFKLIEDEFTIDNGLMTPTLKLKRKKIIEKYEQDLEKLYS